MSAPGRGPQPSPMSAAALLFAVATLGLALALVAALAGWQAERRRANALAHEADSLRRVLATRPTR
jgi:hypothetical protein